MKEFLKRHYYPLAVALVVAVAFAYPPAFLECCGVKLTNFVAPSLQLIMFGMGATLTASDFLGVVKTPWKVAIGAFLQFSVMPFSAFSLARLFGFESEIAAGMILIGSVAGGMASNVIAFLARANVALSVSMTCVSTLIAPFVTPFLMKLLAGADVQVDVAAMMWGMFKIVIFPVAGGVLFHFLLRRQFDERKASVNRVLAGVSFFAICFNLGVSIAPNHVALVQAGALIVLAAVVHIFIGFSLGYWGARLLGRFTAIDETDARTISIEVGMQNGGMACALAITVLGSTAAALPANAAAIVGSVLSPLLADYWRKHDVRDTPVSSGRISDF